jgi:hypothetical protein
MFFTASSCLQSVAVAFSLNEILLKTMASNKPTGDNARKGAVRKRSQIENPKTGLMTKRDKNSGEFMDIKSSGGKFKGVRKEK